MVMSRALITLAALGAVVQSQNCPSPNNPGQCDFDPVNPYICGPDYSCGYEKECLAVAAGYNVDTDCCQAPSPSSCPMLFEPHVCGSKQCPYDNLCIAELAGYSSDQCNPAPEPCPDNDNGQCNGEPSNPQKCGSGKQCQYDNTCLAKAAGYDTSNDCCQDTRTDTACQTIYAPVSCGPPAGKQCPYDNQCLADAAGYNLNQCCAAVPDGIACASIYAPVECGSIPCVYPSQCEATAAGYTEADCCPQAIGACTADNDPVACGDNKCMYSSESCAELAGFTTGQCCKQPKEVGSCGMVLDPVACSTANCVYDNACVAELAGFDPNSCVKIPPPTPDVSVSTDGTTSGAVGKMNAFASVGATLLSFTALFV